MDKVSPVSLNEYVKSFVSTSFDCILPRIPVRILFVPDWSRILFTCEWTGCRVLVGTSEQVVQEVWCVRPLSGVSAGLSFVTKTSSRAGELESHF